MWEAFIGGTFAVIAGWIAVGGRARRDRAAIKEELEILKLLGSQHAQRRGLAEHTDDRLERYLHPPELGSFAWQGVVISAVIALVLLEVWHDIGLEPDSRPGQFVLSAGTGAASVLLAAAGRFAYIWMRPAKRAAFCARMRGDKTRDER
jgi:hypothetical protein